MRTPALIAKALGWPEAQKPRLRVWRFDDGYWLAEVLAPNRDLLDTYSGRTWGEALALGLAALERHSLTGRHA